MMAPSRSAALLLLAALPAGAQPQAEQLPESRFGREDVLGTSSTATIGAPETRATAAEAALYGEVERLRRVFDTYDPESEVNRLPAGATSPGSAELLEVLTRARTWRIETGGAFDHAIEPLLRVWEQAEQSGQLPTARALAAARRRMSEGRWTVDGSRVRRGEFGVALDGIAKGFILDRAAAAALDAGAASLVLEIGGDFVVRGRSAEVRIAAPGRLAENAAPLTSVILEDQALATSGNSVRGYQVAGQHMGHVLDPRTGQPVEHVLQASVIAPNAVDADALATALLVLPPATGMPLVTSREGVECLLVDRDGRLHRSPGWPSSPTQAASAPAAWSAAQQVHLDLEFERPGPSGKRQRAYRRPYVAVWVESEGGAPVRTLALWIQRERWLKDLRRWYRHHRNDRPLIDASSRPTRKPGCYALVWDGLDDDGEPVPHGDYTMVIEMAREHGTYQLARATFNTLDHGTQVAFTPNPELAAAAITIGEAETPVEPPGDQDAPPFTDRALER
ncbi:MAG: DUF2271 domain-containing protein [Planctomycetota bacterium]